MNIYKTGLLIAALFVSAQVFSQSTYQTEIANRLTQFIELSNEKKWSDAFDMVYEGLFEIVGKHELVAMMEGMEQQGFEMETTQFDITSYSQIASTDDLDYVFIEYRSIQAMKFPDEMIGDETVRTALLANLKTSLGGDVTYDDATRRINADGPKSMFAISEKGKSQWMLLENNPEQEQFIGQLIPEGIRTQISTSK